MSGRAYLAIGDVLTLLRQEFPDVTISKIRFLESQGLVNPERTPSGYRKFYEPDVERLRWVLRQQREHFLPLKVIKGRLEQVGDEGNGAGHDEPALVGSERAAPAPSRGGAERSAGAREPGGRSRGASTSALPGFEPARRGRVLADRPAEEVAEPVAAPTGPARTSPARVAPEPAVAAEVQRAPAVPAEPVPDLSDDEMTLDELAAASGCAPGALSGLESFGLLSGRNVAGTVYYGEDALAVARLAASFAAFGVEPRHLRLHKHSADREAGFIEQVVLPLLKQRNPESRRRAHDSVAELSRLGQELRAVLLQRALRDQLGG
ncbi:MAG TPA: MerR family transcriptional regulator [Acidimicrobiales bacterium]|nr:MerR family transcriptional regulator [Acidimicrobiales bacterium]